MESEVTVPCPISALWMKSVTMSSVPTWTQALSFEDAAGAIPGTPSWKPIIRPPAAAALARRNPRRLKF